MPGSPDIQVNVAEARSRIALRTDVPGIPGAPTTQKDLLTVELTKRTVAQRVTEEVPIATTTIVSAAEAQRGIERRFDGRERTAAGRLADPNLDAAEQDSLTNDALVRKLATEGFDALSTIPGAQDKIVARIDSVFDRVPGISKLYPKGSPDRKAYLEAWLRDPNNSAYFAKISAIESGIVATGEGTQQQITAGEAELATARAEHDGVRIRLAINADSADKAGKALKAFDKSKDGGKVITTITGELAAARTRLGEAKGTLQYANARLAMLPHKRATLLSASGLLKDKQPGLTDIDIEEATLMGEIRAASPEQAAAEVDVARLEAQLTPLQTQRAEMQGRIEALEGERKIHIASSADSLVRLNQAYNAMYLATGDVEVLPEKIMSSVETAFIQLITERQQADNADFVAQLTKMAEEATDKRTNALAIGMRATFYKPTRARGVKGFIRGHESTRPDKKVVGDLWGNFLTDGPDPIVRRFLEASGMPDPEIDVAMKDKEYMKDAIAQAMEGLTTQRIRTSNVSDGERDLLRSYDWAGKMFENALKNNKVSQADREFLQANGILEGQTVSALRRADRKTLVRIMVALFGGAALTASSFGVGAPLAVAGVGAIGGSVAMGRS